MSSGAPGVWFINNTIFSEFSAPTSANLHMFNNLILGANATINKGSVLSRNASFISTEFTFTATVDYGDGSDVHVLTLTNRSFDLNHNYANSGHFLGPVPQMLIGVRIGVLRTLRVRTDQPIEGTWPPANARARQSSSRCGTSGR